jgi:rhodanese-related sulfurtransferase
MKNVIIVILALALAVSLIVLAGCSSDDSQAPSEEEDMQTTTETEDMESEEEEMMMEEEDMGPSTYMDVTPEEAAQLIAENPNLIIIDVSPHYAEGHLPGAVSYYLGDGSLEAAIPTLDKEAEYLVYCHVDSVSIAGAQMLIDAGFETVYRLQGNYAAWVNAGYPVEQ